jgi:hypothetical protein
MTQAKYDEEALTMAKIDYSEMKQIEPFVPALRDLRPELFNSLKEEAENL